MGFEFFLYSFFFFLSHFLQTLRMPNKSKRKDKQFHSSKCGSAKRKRTIRFQRSQKSFRSKRAALRYRAGKTPVQPERESFYADTPTLNPGVFSILSEGHIIIIDGTVLIVRSATNETKTRFHTYMTEQIRRIQSGKTPIGTVCFCYMGPAHHERYITDVINELNTTAKIIIIRLQLTQDDFNDVMRSLNKLSLDDLYMAAMIKYLRHQDHDVYFLNSNTREQEVDEEMFNKKSVFLISQDKNLTKHPELEEEKVKQDQLEFLQRATRVISVYGGISSTRTASTSATLTRLASKLEHITVTEPGVTPFKSSVLSEEQLPSEKQLPPKKRLKLLSPRPLFQGP